MAYQSIPTGTEAAPTRLCALCRERPGGHGAFDQGVAIVVCARCYEYLWRRDNTQEGEDDGPLHG